MPNANERTHTDNTDRIRVIRVPLWLLIRRRQRARRTCTFLDVLLIPRQIPLALVTRTVNAGFSFG